MERFIPMKRDISIEKHMQIGNELKKLDEYLTHLRSNLYFEHNVRGKTILKIDSMQKNLNSIKAEMEDIMFSDHPEVKSGLNIYYGPIDSHIQQ